MKIFIGLIFTSLVLTSCSTKENPAGTEEDRKALEETSIGIRSAFSKGDIPAILSYHHPNVLKALGYTHIINGRDELEKDLKNTFKRQPNLVE